MLTCGAWAPGVRALTHASRNRSSRTPGAHAVGLALLLGGRGRGSQTHVTWGARPAPHALAQRFAKSLGAWAAGRASCACAHGGQRGRGRDPTGRALRARSRRTAGVSLRSRPGCERLGSGPVGAPAARGTCSAGVSLRSRLSGGPSGRDLVGALRADGRSAGTRGAAARARGAAWGVAYANWGSCICRILGAYPGEGALGCAQRWLRGPNGARKGPRGGFVHRFLGVRPESVCTGGCRGGRGPVRGGSRGSCAQKRPPGGGPWSAWWRQGGSNP